MIVGVRIRWLNLVFDWSFFIGPEGREDLFLPPLFFFFFFGYIFSFHRQVQLLSRFSSYINIIYLIDGCSTSPRQVQPRNSLRRGIVALF